MKNKATTLTKTVRGNYFPITLLGVALFTIVGFIQAIVGKFTDVLEKPLTILACTIMIIILIVNTVLLILNIRDLIRGKNREE